MRLWRFDKKGMRKDAAVFSDTFSLGTVSDFAMLFKNEADIERMQAEEHHYDYACHFRGWVFFVDDSEIECPASLLHALEICKSIGLAFENRWYSNPRNKVAE